MTYPKEAWKKIAIIVMIIYLSESALGMPNPSAAYCTQLGYTYTTEKTDEGDVGICHFPDGSTCIAWEFIKGKCGEEYSYCRQEGYKLKTVTGVKCTHTPECAVCVQDNGIETEVTKLMDLKLEYGECGDSICTMGENVRNCPKDCPSGSADSFCDGIMDDICDPDCFPEEDADCKIGEFITSDIDEISGKTDKPGKSYSVYYIMLAIILAVLVLFLVYRKTPEKKKWDEMETKYSR